MSNPFSLSFGTEPIAEIQRILQTRSIMDTFFDEHPFLRQDLPVFLLMTGLYNNIHALQNDKALTLLLRTPRIELEPLNPIAIANK